MPTAERALASMPESAQKDLMEWNDYNQPNIKSYITKILSGKQDIKDFLNADVQIKVSDDRPYNEYFFWRKQN